ncbi:uncharacterized protein LOC107042262 [Diachasma alloeum]|uniref:uncharacterized protein LOC107042262 n=1 Tax=Diachasma alloeum TaxID=454923 RepID=UPI000738470B|nr:uncharacterized protein LOC107042262 [Diachasma alloeum]
MKTLRIQETDLLGVLRGCLTGSALTWYRQVELYSWEDACHAFRENFGELDYQVALHEEIASRCQGEDEPVAQFVANLKGIFAKTDPEWPEHQKLTYMYHNTLPKFRIGFNLSVNATLKALEKHAMRQETLYASAKNNAYRSPKARRITQRATLKATIPAEEDAEPTERDHEESIFFEELEVAHALQGRGASSGRGGETEDSVSEARTETISADSDGTGVERTGEREERSPDTVTQESGDGNRIDTLTLESMMDPLKLVSPEMDPNLEFVRQAMKEGKTFAFHVDIEIHGRKIRGLIDSGVSRTFAGEAGIELMSELGISAKRIPPRRVLVANSQLEVVKEASKTPLTPGEGQQSQLQQLLDEKIPVIEGSPPSSKLAPHKIVDESHEPIRQRVRLASHHLKLTMWKEVDDMLNDGIIKPSASDWNSPAVMVDKPSRKYRFCIDFRRVNEVTKKDAYLVANMTGILNELRQAKYISTLDLSAAYWQIPLAEDSKEITAFTVPGRGFFQFERMPYGSTNAPATFQRALDKIIGPEMYPHVFVNLDDIIIVSSTFEENLKWLGKVVDKLRDHGLSINREKSVFCRSEVKYLGFVVNSEELQVDPDKISAVVEFPVPKIPKYQYIERAHHITCLTRYTALRKGRQIY